MRDLSKSGKYLYWYSACKTGSVAGYGMYRSVASIDQTVRACQSNVSVEEKQGLLKSPSSRRCKPNNHVLVAAPTNLSAASGCGEARQVLLLNWAINTLTKQLNFLTSFSPFHLLLSLTQVAFPYT